METSRLLLRPPLAGDADAVAAICNSEYVLRCNAAPVLMREQVAADLEKGAAEQSTLLLVEKESGQVIGAVFIGPDTLRYQVDSLCLSYYLAQAHAGKGYMTEALEAVLAYLFRERKPDVISARAFSVNAASIGLLEKLGFVREGCLRRGVRGYGDVLHDDVLFSILKEDFFAAHPA